jgi:ABC-type multidrug transport system ATPase subunit
MYRLQIIGLNKSYSKGIKALDNVSLNISNGLFGLLGPNGAGKSSLMRTLATLQRPDSGQVLFSGTDIHQKPQELRSQLGYLPQDFGVYPRISAMDLLDHLALLKGLLNKRERTQQVMALLQQTNLYEVRKQSVSTFSGGMKQRFGIAQALLGNPQLIIVDEPTAGLDPQERNRFHDLLSEIGEQVVVLLSTHIVEDVKDLCPEMAVMAQGKVILQGKPAELTETLKGQVWRKTVSKEVLKVYQSSLNVISTRSLMGNTQLHVLADSCPDTGFEPFYPGMEEVYFSALFGAQGTGKEGISC